MVHFVLRTPTFRPSEPLRIEGNCNHNCNHNCNQGRGSLWLSEQVRADGVGGGAGEFFGGVLVGRQHGAAAPSELVLYDAFLDPGLEVERRGGVPGVVQARGWDARADQDGLPVVVVALWSEPPQGPGDLPPRCRRGLECWTFNWLGHDLSLGSAPRNRDGSPEHRRGGARRLQTCSRTGRELLPVRSG